MQVMWNKEIVVSLNGWCSAYIEEIILINVPMFRYGRISVKNRFKTSIGVIGGYCRPTWRILKKHWNQTSRLLPVKKKLFRNLLRICLQSFVLKNKQEKIKSTENDLPLSRIFSWSEKDRYCSNISRNF